jgi:hypothetical protein
VFFHSRGDIIRHSHVQRAVSATQHVTKPGFGLTLHFRPMVYPSARLHRPSGQAVEPTPLSQLLHFFVTRVLAARIAKLLRFHPVGMFLPILGGRVIPVFAIVAL